VIENFWVGHVVRISLKLLSALSVDSYPEMAAMYLSKSRVFRATTDSPFTRDFKHLLPIPRHWLIRRSWESQKIKAVRPSDRIKYWNIVPGDKIADRRDPSKAIHEVLSINKLSNRVFLKGPVQVRVLLGMHFVSNVVI
jgi:hypothetical protein